MCSGGVPAFDWCRGYGAYEGILRESIHLLKYSGMRPLARPLGRRLAALLADSGPVDLIVPVPLHQQRQRSRGFNQSELLAAELSKCTGVPVDCSVLRRVRVTETQTGLSHRERRLNLLDAFRVARPEGVSGRRVALLDDVVTTGATANECARVLRDHGAARVYAVAFARASFHPASSTGPFTD